MNSEFFNYSTLEKIYQDKDINIKITIQIKNSFKKYNIRHKMDNNFPNNINKLINIIPLIINDINILNKNNKNNEKIEFKLLLNEEGSKMSLLSSIYINYNDFFNQYSRL